MPLAQITPNAVDAYAATTQQLRIGQLTITSDDGLITAVSIFNGNAVTPFLNTRLVGRRATIQVVPSTPPQLADPGPHDYRILNERGTFQLEEQAADDADPEPADQGLPVVTPNVTMLSPVDAPGQFHTAFVLVAERMDMAGDLDPDMAYDMPGLVLMKDVHGHFAADDSGYTFKVELPGRSDAQVANFTHKITTPAVRDRIYYVFRSSRYAISGHPYYGGNVHAGVCTADMGNALHDILCIVFEKAPNILNLTGLYNHDITGYFIPNPNKTITRYATLPHSSLRSTIAAAVQYTPHLIPPTHSTTRPHAQWMYFSSKTLPVHVTIAIQTTRNHLALLNTYQHHSQSYSIYQHSETRLRSAARAGGPLVFPEQSKIAEGFPEQSKIAEGYDPIIVSRLSHVK
ncbi:hypothetical protein PLESTM_001938600 [Pleodorina starrii]|nr:hypothetical protein PLESTM_001938600 [Pleodorina starrii]